ncbi:hypothetical protein Hanom_Chr14g01319331 [Helianthus anomalus]
MLTCKLVTRHVFVSCGFTFGVWSKIWRWCKLIPAYYGTIEDMLQWQNSSSLSVWGKKIVRGIIMVTCWALWKVRNKKVFQNSDPKVEEVVALVKSMSFIWLKYRSVRSNIEWKDWVVYMLYIL